MDEWNNRARGSVAVSNAISTRRGAVTISAAAVARRGAVTISVASTVARRGAFSVASTASDVSQTPRGSEIPL